MRVLLLNQIFWPDRAGSARLLTDLARHLAARGLEVVVLAGGTACELETKTAPPVRIVRTPSLLNGRSVALRLLSFVCYLAMAQIYCLLAPKPDLVVTLTTPPLLSITGYIAKKLRGCRFFIWEMDLYPEAAMDVDLLRRGSPAARLLFRIANAVRRRADGIIVIGECMRARLERNGVPPEKLLLAENWADGELLKGAPLPSEFPITILYSGNLGRVHDIDTIAQVMLEMRGDRRFRFLFVGGGPLRSSLEAFCEKHDIRNAEFAGYRSSDALPLLFGEAHIGLILLRSACLGTSVPSKMYEYMAAGRPLLFIGPPGSTTALVIEKYGCGWHRSPGDVAGLVHLLHTLGEDSGLLRVAGANARRAFLSGYDLPQGVAKVIEVLGIA